MTSNLRSGSFPFFEGGGGVGKGGREGMIANYINTSIKDIALKSFACITVFDLEVRHVSY